MLFGNVCKNLCVHVCVCMCVCLCVCMCVCECLWCDCVNVWMCVGNVFTCKCVRDIVCTSFQELVRHSSCRKLWGCKNVVVLVRCARSRVGQNCIYAPYMTVYLVISLPTYRIYTVYIWFWPTLAKSCIHV